MDGWWSYFDYKKGREVKGDGFQVTVYPLGGIRYSTRDRHVTLDTRSIDETETLRRRWLFFPNVRLLIVVPSRLKWDGAEALEWAEAENVKARIS